MTGRKDDQGKARWDLLPFRAVAEVVAVLTFGAGKYGAWNWRMVESPRERYTAALLRHVVAWINGERHDPETGIHHLAHAGCCVLFLLDFEVADVDRLRDDRDAPHLFGCVHCARDVRSLDAVRFQTGDRTIPTCPDCGEELDPKPEA